MEKTPVLSRELSIIYHISQAIVRNKNVNDLMSEVMDILDNDLKASRITLTLFHFLQDELIIAASKGLSPSETARGKYRLGEGVTGEAALKKQAVLIPDISQEDRFLDKMKARKDPETLAFICCPILKDADLIGTISVDLSNRDMAAVQEAYQILLIVANILAEAVSEIRRQVEEDASLKAENQRLLQELGNRFKPSNIMGNSGNMQTVYEQITNATENHAPVLLLGEAGTGKELVSKSIHYSSIRKNNSFIPVNSSALPGEILERELFGFDQEGDLPSRAGLLEVAQGGTIFIEEISDLSELVQEKLERYIQTQSFQRVNGEEVLRSNVRIIAASTKNVDELVNQGGIRGTLYYTLNMNSILIPPLRDRKSDITLLADYFLEELGKSYGKKISRISTPAINMMMAYHWPGNVGELRNCLERALVNTTDDVIHGYNLPPTLQTAQESDVAGGGNASEVNDLVAAVNTFERELIVEALKKHRGNAAAAARSLNTTPRVLNYKFKKFNIDLKEFKKNARR